MTASASEKPVRMANLTSLNQKVIQTEGCSQLIVWVMISMVNFA